VGRVCIVCGGKANGCEVCKKCREIIEVIIMWGDESGDR